MRWVFLSVIVVLAIATLIFALQNFRVVPVEFLNFSLRAPLAVLIVAVSTSSEWRLAEACWR